MKKINLSLSIIIVLIMPSCVYYPQLSDIALINKKNDLRVDAAISTMISANSTISYGLTDKIAVQIYGDISGDIYYCQGAAGYYKTFANNKIFELYGGVGNGYGSAYNDANPGHLRGKYQTYFTQINFGKLNCKFAHLDYGIGLKTGYFHSNLIDDNYYTKNDLNSIYIDNLLQVEPIFFLRLGGENLKFNVKLGGCWMYKFTNIDKYYPYNYWNVGIGLNYSL